MHPVDIFIICVGIASTILYLWLLFGWKCTWPCCGKANTKVTANDEDQLPSGTLPEENTRQSTVLSQLENSNAEHSDESSEEPLFDNEIINADVLDITDLVHECLRVTPSTVVNKPDTEAETQTNSMEIQLVMEEMQETNTDQKQALRIIGPIVSPTCEAVSQRQEHLEENDSFDNLYSFLDEDLIAEDICNSSETSTMSKDLQENGKQLPTFNIWAPFLKETHLTPIVSKEDLNDSYIMPEAGELNEETSADYGIYNDIDQEHPQESRAGNRKLDALSQKQALSESSIGNWELINPVYESFIDIQGVNESDDNRCTLLDGMLAFSDHDKPSDFNNIPNDVHGKDQIDTLSVRGANSEENQYSVLDDDSPDVSHDGSSETWTGLPSKGINRNITPSLPPKTRFSTVEGKLKSADKCQTKLTVSRKYHCYENVKFMNQHGNTNTSKKKKEDV